MSQHAYLPFLPVETIDGDKVVVRIDAIIAVVRPHNPFSYLNRDFEARPPGYIIWMQSPADGIHVSDAEGDRIKDHLATQIR